MERLRYQMRNEFGKVVNEHRNRVYSYAYYSLGNSEEAEDVTQEVFVRMWKHWDRLNQQTVPAWITRVMKNLCIDMIRKRKAHNSRIIANGEHPQLELAQSSLPTPEQAVHSDGLREHVRRALATIREPYRSILILREIQEQSYEEICESLDLPLNTVKSYLHRGRSMLRDKIRTTLRHEAI